MIEYRSLVSLTLDEARVLLEPEVIRRLFPGIDLDTLPQAGSTRLVEALSTPELPVDVWRGRLAGLHVSLFDINLVSAPSLLRLMRNRAGIVNLLLGGRPYFSLTAPAREDNALGEAIAQAAPYLAHEGYWFQDKPQGKLVELFPAQSGVIVKYRLDSDLASVRILLNETGLIEMAHKPVDRLVLCHWKAELTEHSARLFALKHRETVETVAPVLQDRYGQERFVYPDRLDLALLPESGEPDWTQIARRYELRTVERYARDYGSVRVNAYPHDLGALYRTLRALVNEPSVRFVEPTDLIG